MAAKGEALNIDEIRKQLSEAAQGLRLEVYPEVTSTNTMLKQEAVQGEPEGKVILAERQTAGKGRLGRRFFSPENTGLYMSLLLRPELAPQESLLLTTAAAVAAAKAIESVTGEPAAIKWVNDIYCRGKKAVGILTEGGMQTDSRRLAYAIVGIGINLWPPEGGFPEELRGIAGSVFPEKPMRARLRETMAALVLSELMQIYPVLTQRKFMQEYRSRSMVIGRQVRLQTAEHTLSVDSPLVKVLDIDDDAQLVIQDSDGQIRRVSSGEVSVKLS